MTTDLKRETQKNLLIVFSLNIFDKIVIFFGLVVLARLLRPEDFGILAITEILIAFIGMWNEHIFETASIATTRKDNFDTTLSIAFFIRGGLSVLLYAALYIASGFWAGLYGNEKIGLAIKILGLNILIYNLIFVPTTILTKERRFDRLIIPTVSKNSLVYIIAIILAFWGFGFWSLIFSRIISYLFVAISLYIIRPWRIRFIWNRLILSELFRYAKGMYLFMFLAFLTTQIDKFVVSRISGVVMTGYYTMAYSFGTWVITNIFAVADRVAFPLYSEIKTEEDILRRAYLKFFRYIFAVSVPILTGLALFAGDFVMLFLGAKWFMVITPLKILAIAGFFGLLGNISNSLLKAIGRLDIEVKRNLVLAVVLILTLTPLSIKYGIVGSSFAVLISFALVQPLYLIYAVRTIGIRTREIMRILVFTTASSLAGGACYVILNSLFFKNVGWIPLRLILSILAYSAVYFALIVSMMHEELVADMKSYFKKNSFGAL